MYTCEICSKSLISKGNLKRHVKEVHLGKQRDVKGVIPTPLHQSQQLNENNQFGKGYAMQGVFDIRLKENFKLFISGPSRCGKTVFVSKLLENIHTFAKHPPNNVIYVYKAWQPKFDEIQTMSVTLWRIMIILSIILFLDNLYLLFLMI